MTQLDFHKTGPDFLYRINLQIPRGMDLVFNMQLRAGKGCSGFSPGDPYDLAGHTITAHIYEDELSTTPIHIVQNADWTRKQSEGQTGPVDDIASHIFKWDELADLEVGEQYWIRIWFTDAVGTNFGLAQGPIIRMET